MADPSGDADPVLACAYGLAAAKARARAGADVAAAHLRADVLGKRLDAEGGAEASHWD